jgi:hypothetical protein
MSILGPVSPEPSRLLPKNANRNVQQSDNSQVGAASLAAGGVDALSVGVFHLGVHVSTYRVAETMVIGSGFYLSLSKLDLFGITSLLRL